jgi:hypothetical protein
MWLDAIPWGKSVSKRAGFTLGIQSSGAEGKGSREEDEKVGELHVVEVLER